MWELFPRQIHVLPQLDKELEKSEKAKSPLK